MSVRCVVPAKNQLGESALWDAATQSFYWVDIVEKRLQRFHPESGETQAWTLPHRPCTVALREGGDALLALDIGLALFDFGTEALDIFAPLETDQPDTRLNDGKCDRAGRFWIGSMDETETRELGRLYRVDADLSVSAHESPVIIANSVSFSPANDVMYLSDSPNQVIYRHPYDAATGELGPREVFARLDGERHPDGSCVDAEGCLWNAEWGGWRVTRYRPDGTVERTVEMPVERCTCPALGGPDLKTLFVTTAREGLSDEALARQPDAGGVFAVETDVQGLADARFAG